MWMYSHGVIPHTDNVRDGGPADAREERLGRRRSTMRTDGLGRRSTMMTDIMDIPQLDEFDRPRKSTMMTDRSYYNPTERRKSTMMTDIMGTLD